MCILFICSSLEPGEDGVGDYTRRLAGELLKQENAVTAVAFYDRHVQIITEETSNNLLLLRLPYTMNRNQRIAALYNWINQYHPDWISLQYVGFGFHNYGLPVELLKLRTIAKDAKIHIMFHELWCGMAHQAKMRERLLGALQKVFIKSFLWKIKPEKVFTNVESYSGYLKQFGITPVLAPVFGNINPAEISSTEDWNEKSEIHSLIDGFNKDHWLIIGFFGAVYSCIGLELLIRHSALTAQSTGRKFGILRIGKDNQLLKRIVDTIGGACYWHTGLLTQNMVNRAMNYVHCAVVTTPADGLNKSGSAITWLERGIPVLISHSDSAYSAKYMLPKGIVQVKDTSDIMYALSIDSNAIRLANRLQDNVQLYASLDNTNKQ